MNIAILFDTRVKTVLTFSNEKKQEIKIIQYLACGSVTAIEYVIHLRDETFYDVRA